MDQKADYWIQKLGLQAHPEGGYFKEVYRSDESIAQNSLNKRYSGSRNISTSIYFLLDGNQVSKLHRIQSDEIWHHYTGSALKLTLVTPEGELKTLIVGKDPEQNQELQVVIPKNHWFGAKPTDPQSFALMGCTVAPGFDFDDFEMVDSTNLPPEILRHKEALAELF